MHGFPVEAAAVVALMLSLNSANALALNLCQRHTDALLRCFIAFIHF